MTSSLGKGKTASDTNDFILFFDGLDTTLPSDKLHSYVREAFPKEPKPTFLHLHVNKSTGKLTGAGRMGVVRHEIGQKIIDQHAKDPIQIHGKPLRRCEWFV